MSLTSSSSPLGTVGQKDEAPSLKLPPAAGVGETRDDPAGSQEASSSGGQGSPALLDLEGGGARGRLTQHPHPTHPVCALETSAVADSRFQILCALD